MSLSIGKYKNIGGCMILLLIIFTCVTSGHATGEAGKQFPKDRFVTIDFNNVDINVFIKFISELTGKNFVVDQRVRGNVTIISPTKISIAEAYKVAALPTLFVIDQSGKMVFQHTGFKKELEADLTRIIKQLIK
jgi:type II secretory pathway component GspD/PulD (secretin)